MLQSRETSESRELPIGNTTALAIDNLKYDYTGNKLIRVTDEQQNPSGYPYMANPGTIGYDNDSSDGNGNMISNPDKGISAIQYNYLNLPQQITQNAKVTQYTYRADGVKVKKLFGDIETDYLDGLQYKSTFQIESWNGEGVFQPDPNEIPVLKLRIIPTAEGYYDVLNERYVYNYTDHLGNVRLSYTDTNKDGIIQPRRYYTSICTGKFCIDDWKPGEIVEVNNYYPFGMMHNYTATTQNAYQYKYNGKELQESGMYDYGARMYMPDLGRWGVIDPLAETSRRWSTYAYAYDNPVMFIDPDGMQNVSALHWKFDRNSTILGNSWFDDSYVSSGFGNNFKTMWNGGDHGGSGSGYTFRGDLASAMLDYFKKGGTLSGLYISWWTLGKPGNASTSQEMVAHIMKLTGSIQKNLTNIANDKDFSSGHLITSEAVATFADYSLNKALRPDYSVNYTVLDDAAKPYRVTTIAGIKMRPTTAATISKVAKYGGYALAGVAVVATELQYADGQIGNTERIITHVMTGVGLIPTPWTMGAAVVFGIITGGYQSATGRSIFNDLGLGPQKK